MITDKGKDIITKFMAGQAPAYGAYIAVGCGHVPGATLPASSQESMIFETVRTAVSSVSIVQDEMTGEPYIVFASELPTQNRYSITEAGLYPSSSNPVAQSGSRQMFDFTNSERWEVHEPTRTLSIPDYSTLPLSKNNPGVININDRGNDGSIDQSIPIFSVAADDSLFLEDDRLISNEQPRMFTDTYMMRGNTSYLSVDGSGFLVPESGSTHIHYVDSALQLGANSSEDLIKLAYSVNMVDRTQTTQSTPKYVRILVQFSSDETEAAGGQYANFQVVETNVNLSTNAYFVAQNRLDEIKKTELFSWSQVKIAKIFASVFEEFTTASYSIVDNVATITTQYDHGFEVGFPVTVAGVTSIADGTYTITATTADTVSFAYTASNTSGTDTNGTVVSASGNYYVSLDAMRFDNIFDARLNPLYGLVAYSSVSRNVSILEGTAYTDIAITKNQNENSYIQIRIPVGVA
jgi:hypothetical protein